MDNTYNSISFSQLDNNTQCIMNQHRIPKSQPHARLLAKLQKRKKRQPEDNRSNTPSTCSDEPKGNQPSESLITMEELQELRLTINQRERRRMQDLNLAMDGLRSVLPYAGSPSVRKLSKIATLLLAKNYILLLTKTISELRQQLVLQCSPTQITTNTGLSKTQFSLDSHFTNLLGDLQLSPSSSTDLSTGSPKINPSELGSHTNLVQLPPDYNPIIQTPNSVADFNFNIYPSQLFPQICQYPFPSSNIFNFSLNSNDIRTNSSSHS